MNYIRHLTGFYEKIHEDPRLNPTHISLYLALFQFWNLNHFQNPISISRHEMMKLSKIAAYGTYHKCIKELQEFGYIEYLPSFNPYKGSLVNLFNFENSDVQQLNKNHIKKQTSSEQALNQHHIKIDTGIEQALIPSINYINLLNYKHNSITTPETSSNFNQVFYLQFLSKKLSQNQYPKKVKKKKSCAKRKRKAHSFFRLLSKKIFKLVAKRIFLSF